MVVLPKAWSSTGQPVARCIEWPTDHHELIVAVHEGDTCTVLGDERRVRLLEAAVRDSVWRAGDGPRGALLEPGLPVGGSIGSADATLTGPLLDLAARLGQLRVASEAATTPASAPLLRPLLYLEFTREVESQLQHVRRDYQPVSEVLGVIRGRVNARSLALAIRTGAPRLECDYEDFTHRTPLMIVIASALDVVVRDHRVPVALSNSHEISSIQQRAVRLRRNIDDVESAERRSALAIGRGLRLHRGLSRWRRSLDLALAVLAMTEQLPTASQGRHLTIELRTQTDVMWQTIVGHALAIASEGGAIARHSTDQVPAAWLPVGASPGAERSEPDFLVSTSSGRFWCLDAKYKVLDPRTPPAEADRYQIFAYTHLSGATPGVLSEVTHAGLVYPWPSDASPPLEPTEYRRGGSGGQVPLHIERLPFVRPIAISSREDWQAYLRGIADRLLELLTG